MRAANISLNLTETVVSQCACQTHSETYMQLLLQSRQKGLYIHLPSPLPVLQSNQVGVLPTLAPQHTPSWPVP